MSARRLRSGLAMAAAWVVLVLAPQSGYLVSRAVDIPWLHLVVPNVAFALLAAGLTLAHSRETATARATGAAVAWTPWLVAALAVASASPLARRAVVPVALAGAAAWLLPTLEVRPILARVRGPAAGVLAFAASGLLLSQRPDGFPGLWTGLGWGVYLVVAMVGWGGLVFRIAGVGRRPDWGLRGGLGVAATVAFGAVLNLLWSISPGVLLAWLAAGFGAWVADLGPPRELLRGLGSRPATALALGLLALLALLQLAGSLGATVDTMVDTPAFDLHDDLQAYLVFPTKMLALGSIGAEPFEARRLLTLGGQPFLQSLVLAVLPMRALHLLDAGVCLLLFAALAWGGARAAGLGRGVAAFVAALALVVPHHLMRGNTSSVLSGALVLLTWLRLVHEGWSPLARRGGQLLVALVASAACALKPTLVPAAAALVLVTAAGELLVAADRRRVLVGIAGAIALGAAFLLPWMISVHESSGTLLYPVLGKGFEGAVWSPGYTAVAGGIAPSPSDWVRAWFEPLSGLLPLWLLLALAGGRARGVTAPAAGAALLATVAALILAGDPTLSRSLARYLFPVEAAVLLMLLIVALSRLREGREGVIAAAAAVVVSALLVAPQARTNLERTIDSLVAVVDGEGDAVSEWDRRVAAEVSAARPPGTMLATVRAPFLLEPDRGGVAIMSLPGMASPPPGLRLDRSPEEIAGYLRARGIRSLAYGGLGGLPPILSLTEARIVNSYPRSRTRWVMLRSHERYREVVRELAGRTRRLYDDGSTVLLDLTEPVITLRPEDQGPPGGGFVDGVWSGERAVLQAPSHPLDVRAVIVRTMGWHPDLDQAGLEVEVDGRPLERAGRRGTSLLFLAEPPLDRVSEITLRSQPPSAAGLPAWVAALGVDVQAVELAGDPSVADTPVRRARQKVAGALDPAAVAARSGFFADFNWTGARADLRGISWAVEDRTQLLVSLYPVHPWRPDWARAEARLFANGVELPPAGVEGDALVFGLLPEMREIHRLRIEARTFVPREVVGSHDDRSLGLPVRRIALR